METVRRCGLVPGDAGTERTVWARRHVATGTCPVSYITAESIALIQEFQAWKFLGGVDPYALPARTIDAFCVLERELRAEMENGQQ